MTENAGSRHPTVLSIGALWRMRLRASIRSLRQNWALFAENKIGLFGLGIILFFGLMASAHPILMNTIWEPRIYDPIIGYDTEVLLHPSSPSVRHLLGTDPLGRDVLSQLMYSTALRICFGLVGGADNGLDRYFDRGLHRVLWRRAGYAFYASGRSHQYFAVYRLIGCVECAV